MFKLEVLLGIFVSQIAYAKKPSPEPEVPYARFAAEMDRYGFTWEAVEVTTDDSYILTTFHLTGNSSGPFSPTRGSVLIQHGDYQDGASWISNYFGLPMHLKLAEAGYDVWIGSNRGTEYSSQHLTLTTDDAAYWAWSWAEMGLYDTPANISKIKELTGEEKVFFIGYSQGTVQLLYGLAHREEDFYANNLHKAVLLAPCTVAEQSGRNESYYYDSLYAMPQAGVYSLYGDTSRAEIRSICRSLGRSACQVAKCSYCRRVAVQSETHWFQNSYQDRFQEYASGYLDGDVITDLIPIDTIDKVPLAMLVGENDSVCSYARALETAAIVPTVEHFELFEGQGHLYFNNGSDERLMTVIKEQLQVPI